MDDADQNSKQEVDVHPRTKYGKERFDLADGAISFMQWDKSRSVIWMGTWKETSHSNVCAVRVKISSKNNAYFVPKDDGKGLSLKKHTLPVNSVQGIAVRANSNDKDAENPVIYLSKSYGSDTSKIYKWLPGTSLTHVDRVAEGYRGLENMDFDPKSPYKLWGIAEAGSKYYQKRKDKCGGHGPWPYHPGYIYADIDVGTLPARIV